jgi:hypothetical protein
VPIICDKWIPAFARMTGGGDDSGVVTTPPAPRRATSSTYYKSAIDQLSILRHKPEMIIHKECYYNRTLPIAKGFLGTVSSQSKNVPF